MFVSEAYLLTFPGLWAGAVFELETSVELEREAAVELERKTSAELERETAVVFEREKVLKLGGTFLAVILVWVSQCASSHIST